MVNLILLVVMLAVFGYTDAKERKVYNSRVLPASIICVIAGVLTQGVVTTVTGAIVTFAITFAAFIVGITGGGDVKLLTACGALIGVSDAVNLLRYSVMVGAVVGIVIVTAKLIRKESIKDILKTETPFIPFCFLGSLIVIFERIVLLL